MKKVCLGLLPLFLLVVLTGCGAGDNAGDPPGGAEAARPDREADSRWEKLEALRDEGVYLVSWGETEEGLQIDLYRADQRAIRKIREAVGDEVPVIIREQEEVLFVRGRITEISDEEAAGYLSIFVEGKEDPDTDTGRAYLSIGDETRILKPGEAGYRALSYQSLETGQTVEVWIAGAVLTSLPPRAGAVTVIITD